MNSTKRQSVLSTRQRRGGFTLVELLVAITIFAILATLAIGAWRGTEADRVSNAAATFKNALEGAKSRAVKTGESRGLRLLPDPNDSSMITSIVYVDGGGLVTGELYAEYDNRGTGLKDQTDPDYLSLSSGKWRVSPTNVSLWENYESRGLIGPGTLIEIPAGESIWLRFTGTTETVGGAKWWVLEGEISDATPVTPMTGDFPEDGRAGYRPGTTHPQDAMTTGAGFGLSTAYASDAMTYRMQLMPAILPGAEPIALPANTCIDLVGSKVPERWRPDSSSGKTAYGPVTGNMDILFTPRGTVARPLATEGLLHFRVASVSDVLLGKSQVSVSAPDAGASRPDPVVLSDPEHGARLVSIITQTGAVLRSEVAPSKDVVSGFNNDAYDFNNPTDTSSYMNPYYFVLRGQEAK